MITVTYSKIQLMKLEDEEIIHNEIPQDESESTAGVTDTMFTATDFLEDEER